ncbi:hypothetical protein AT03_11725 [Hafnia alvei FB1]|uniref:DUF5405 domain-containing protein n=2 Tax=Hafnia alvei TaxID=569 RepID=A0A097R801_HAFAL|nr:DUF5405 family protein [Hafnia alvei]AIU74868.1 hypothetical protein AT03_11725 [Hafnia alvei FB1]KKI45326.1 hypothetical protein XK86_08080 [Hafnia alvei]
MMIHISIGKEFVITSDSLQFILNQKKIAQKGSKAGEEWLDPIGYFPSLNQLVTELVNRHVRNSTVASIAGLGAEIGSIGKLCQEAFTVGGGKK